MYGYHNVYSLNWILLTQGITAIIIITSDSCKLGDSKQIIILCYSTELNNRNHFQFNMSSKIFAWQSRVCGTVKFSLKNKQIVILHVVQ